MVGQTPITQPFAHMFAWFPKQDWFIQYGSCQSFNQSFTGMIIFTTVSLVHQLTYLGGPQLHGYGSKACPFGEPQFIACFLDVHPTQIDSNTF
jgi:hypothetical protein